VKTLILDKKLYYILRETSNNACVHVQINHL